MIHITIPNNNIAERSYAVDIIINDFLGLEYKLKVENNNSKAYTIVLENGDILIIEDHFFSNYPNALEYLKKENIPEKIEFGSNDFIIEKNIPIIYGTNTLKAKNQKPKTITCSIDIFASSFFMLTRWEEYVNKTRDLHDRFPATASLAYKENFLDRPVVNEYVEMLWNILCYLGINQKRKIRNHQLILTHDIDTLYMWKNWKQVFRIAAGDVVKRHNPVLAMERFSEYYLVSRKKIKDPFDTFDWLMDKSEAVGVKSRFYFMSGGITSYDNNYKINEPKALKLIEGIKKRRHIIGIHPSYNAYNNFEQFKKEKELLEKVTKQKIVEGREHYLRFEIPTTWQIWEDNGMEIDSTCGYADKEGFRCGTGDEFSVFNILSREKLKLKERPLIFMDDNHHSYSSISMIASFGRVKKLIKMSSKYNSPSTLLFHNSIFANDKNIDFIELYDKLVELT